MHDVRDVQIAIAINVFLSMPLEHYREPSRPLASQIESFDYGHGGAPAIVDYNHGKKSTGSESHFIGQRSTGFPLPPEPSFPGYPGVGGYSFSPGTMPFFPAVVDSAQAALIAAAYTAQAGKCFLCSSVYVCIHGNTAVPLIIM